MRALTIAVYLLAAAFTVGPGGSSNVVPWGNVIGDIDRQPDLQQALAAKQPRIIGDLTVPGIIYTSSICARGIIEVPGVQFPDGTTMTSAHIDGGTF